ncbi:MAG: spore germination protein, partial [Desulfitobacterium hafniense]|nr:spore germination protein [Desulfitobacterium hafniense]
MFKKLLTKLKALSSETSKQQKEAPSTNTQLSKNIDVNLKFIQDTFVGTSDLITREFKLGSEQQVKAFVVMIAGLVNEASVNENLMKPLMFIRKELNKENAFVLVKESALSVANLKDSRTLEETIDSILSGDSALFIDGSDIALVASIRGWEARGVDEPKTEAVVRGPREGFVESMGTNMALLRRKIKNPNLKFVSMKIGKQTKTDICVAYIKGIANEKIVQEVKTRLNRIETDSILESGYIEAFIEDPPFSLFPTVGNSEKPDVVSAKLLEGRVVILVDGTPFALTVPYLFIEAFQASEDYYSRPYYASIIRIFRWLSFFLSTFTPGLYVAITTFHQELLPPALLVSIAAAQEGTPFPAVVEVFVMGIMFEILR